MKLLRGRRLPIFVELYIFIVITFLIPLAVVTVNNNNKLLQYSEAEIIRSAENNINSTEKLVSLICNNVISTTINLSKDPLISDISNLISFDQFQNNANNMQLIRKVANKLKVMEYSDTLYHSIYFYLKDSDYVITTKNDTVKLDSFYDLDWMNSIDTGLRAFLPYRVTSSGNTWLYRKLPFDMTSRISGDEGYTNVVTFLYHTTNFTTSAKGYFVVNMYEKELCNIMNNSGFDENSSVFIINESGKVISHLDKNMLNADLSRLPYIKTILEKANRTPGYTIDNSNGQRTLYCFIESDFNDWIFVSMHSLDLLLNRSIELRNQAIFLAFGISIILFLVAYLYSLYMTTPIKELMKSISSRRGYQTEKKSNEISFLIQAFEKITKQEEYLNSLVKKSELSMKEVFLQNLLKGIVVNDKEIQKDEIFPYPHFMVAMIAPDNLQLLYNRYTPDQRFFVRRIIQKKCNELEMDGIIFESILYDEDRISIIINLETYDCIETPERLKNIFANLQEELQKVIGNSISIGISGCHSSLKNIPDSVSESMDALRRKLLSGHGSIIFWTQDNSEKSRYYYPFARERHILNYLNTGQIDKVENEIHRLVQEIREMPDISCENIIQVFNQLINATIKYFVENNIAIGRIFPNVYNLYLEVAGKETLEDIEHYMINFYKKIHSVTQSDGSNDKSNEEKIFSYLNSNYRTELNFEKMATDLQISYSYIRKIVKSITGKSVLDYINSLRISEGKRLLLQTDMTIAEIALNLGYNNVQSFNRFFKKYEGITPGEFRSSAR
ncbi:MAG: AraC family transcriptional regulator [Clostridiaceae bacterium]|nr:AraC family transcriptional regulator [Clostridiaceae bacterium]